MAATCSIGYQQKGKLEMRSVGRFGLLTFGLAIALAVAIAWYFSLDAVLSWLIAITLVTFITYGYDKAVAGSDRTRVPEKVLLALTFAGGTIGAIVARPVFHHKTAKASFRVKFSLVVGLQVILGLVYFIWVESKL
jgi:uncharacterized membrane protein YsdA (DUF1294 family)